MGEQMETRSRFGWLMDLVVHRRLARYRMVIAGQFLGVGDTKTATVVGRNCPKNSCLRSCTFVRNSLPRRSSPHNPVSTIVEAPCIRDFNGRFREVGTAVSRAL